MKLGEHLCASLVYIDLSLRQVKKYNAIEFMRTDVLNRIKETLRKVVPAGGHAFFVWLASKKRGTSGFGLGYIDLVRQTENRSGGDYNEDYNNVSYPLVGLGWSLNECVSPVLYTLKDWMKYHFSPPYTQHKRREDTIAMSISMEDITAVVAHRKEKADSKAQTHNGVVGQLELNYVSKGLLTKDEGRLYSRLLQYRITGDYNDFF